MCFLMSTTSSRRLPPKTAERQAAGTVPLMFHSRSAPCGSIERWRRELRPARYFDSDPAKTTPWPGATPVLAPFSGPKPLRALGVAPGHGETALARSSVDLPRQGRSKSCYEPQSNFCSDHPAKGEHPCLY
jgi:hypothetical protein